MSQEESTFYGGDAWGEEHGQRAFYCLGKPEIPGPGTLGAVWHGIQQVAPGPVDLGDPGTLERGSFLGNRQPF